MKRKSQPKVTFSSRISTVFLEMTHFSDSKEVIWWTFGLRSMCVNFAPQLLNLVRNTVTTFIIHCQALGSKHYNIWVEKAKALESDNPGSEQTPIWSLHCHGAMSKWFYLSSWASVSHLYNGAAMELQTTLVSLAWHQSKGKEPSHAWHCQASPEDRATPVRWPVKPQTPIKRPPSVHSNKCSFCDNHQLLTAALLTKSLMCVLPTHSSASGGN